VDDRLLDWVLAFLLVMVVVLGVLVLQWGWQVLN